MVKERKRSTRFIIAACIIGILAIVAGGIIFLVGLGQLDWNFANIDQEVLTAAEDFVSEQFVDTVSLQGNWDFEIHAGDEFRVQFFTSNHYRISLSVNMQQGGNYAFSFTEERTASWLQTAFGNARRNLRVIVTVPTDRIDLTVSGGSIGIIAHDINFYSVNISGSSGRHDFRNVDVKYNFLLRGSSTHLSLINTTIGGRFESDGSSTRFDFRSIEVAQSLAISGNSVHLNLLRSAIGGILHIQGSSTRLGLANVTMAEMYLRGNSIHVTTYRVIVENTVTVGGSSLRWNSSHTALGGFVGTGSSMRINLLHSTVERLLATDGSSNRVNLYRSAVQHINLRGSSTHLDGINADISSVTARGSSVRINLLLIGTQADLGRLSATGSSTRLTLDGTETRNNAANWQGSGFKNFTADGSSVRVVIAMTGGQTAFIPEGWGTEIILPEICLEQDDGLFVPPASNNPFDPGFWTRVTRGGYIGIRCNVYGCRVC